MTVKIDRFCLRTDSKTIRAECSLIFDSVIINRVRLLEYEPGKFSMSLPYWKDVHDNVIHEYVLFKEKEEKEKVLEAFISVYRASTGVLGDLATNGVDSDSVNNSLRGINLKLKNSANENISRRKSVFRKHKNYGRVNKGDRTNAKV